MPSYQVIAVAAETPQDLIKSHEFEASDTLAARQYADDWAATNVPKDSSIMIRVFAGRVFCLSAIMPANGITHRDHRPPDHDVALATDPDRWKRG